jgi:hypothetical protein
MEETRLEDLPNIGPKLAAALREVGVAAPADLTGRPGRPVTAASPGAPPA